MIRYKYIITLPIIVFGVTSLSGRILEMDNSQLDERFKGVGAGGYYKELLEQLNTSDGPKLIQKFLSDVRLKSRLYGQIADIEDDTLRDGLLVDYLRDDAAWVMEENPFVNQRNLQTSTVSECVLRRFPAMRHDKELTQSLTYTFLSPQGREAVAAAYHKFLKTQVVADGSTASMEARLFGEVREGLVKFGTREFVFPPDPSLTLSGPMIKQPLKKMRVESDQMRSQPRSIEKKEIGYVSVPRHWLFWAAGGFAALVTILFVLQKMKQFSKTEPRAKS